jgi:DNA-binding transcriptional regulator YhcF (GntR family)
MQLYVDAHSPIPIRRQLAEQLKHFIESGGFPREQALPSIRELAGFLGINPNTVARVIEDLKRDGYVQVRRGKGVFVAPDPPSRQAEPAGKRGDAAAPEAGGMMWANRRGGRGRRASRRRVGAGKRGPWRGVFTHGRVVGAWRSQEVRECRQGGEYGA